MTWLLSLGFWQQKFAEPLAKAVGALIAAVIIVGVVVGFCVWLRHDARMDERRDWQSRQLYARVMDGIKLRTRQREASDIAQGINAEMARMLVESEAARRAAEDKIAKTGKAGDVAYPKDIIKAMNK